MKLWAIGDLHLPSARAKPMDIFGAAWDRHPEKIAARWRERVGPEDTVLLLGDFSWAMRLTEARCDFDWLRALPAARKILIEGNHDYWWTTRTKMREIAGPCVEFLHAEALHVPPFVIAGTRLWDLPAPERTAEENAERERLCAREAERLAKAMEQASALPSGRLVAITHFPPLYTTQERTVFTDILDRAAPEAAVFGHLHGASHAFAFQGMRGRTRYILASADAIDFAPLLVADGD
jgi:uncharacterized protein